MKKLIWIDTDIGGDCDDAAALALACIASGKAEAEILGMTFTTSASAGPACMDAINTYYGCPGIPIGVTDRKGFCSENVNPFQEYVARNFPNRFYHSDTERFLPAENAVRLMRKGLVAAADGSVTIVCIGQLNNVSDLLDSRPDDISPLTGVELVRKKVNEFAVMGGLFAPDDGPVIFCGQPYEAEYNITTDIASARNFVTKCNCKVVFCDFLLGYRVLTGGPLLEQKDPRNPVTAAYRIFQDRPRESWDPLTVLYAVYGTGELFTCSESGIVTVQPDGKTVFEPAPGADHYYLRLRVPEKRCADVIDQILMEGVKL